MGGLVHLGGVNDALPTSQSNVGGVIVELLLFELLLLLLLLLLVLRWAVRHMLLAGDSSGKNWRPRVR